MARPVRVHQDIILTDQMFVDRGATTYPPAGKTRYEQEGGGTKRRLNGAWRSARSSPAKSASRRRNGRF